MSTKPSYFIIGIFVIVACALLVAAIVFFGSGLFAKDKVLYETYFNEPVSGLSVGSPVELLGVKIGQVEQVTFVRDEYTLPAGPEEAAKYEHYVMVVCAIGQENRPDLTAEQRQALLEDMIARGLRLQVTPNLLTGQSFLQGDYFDPNRFSVLEIGWEPRHLYISSVPATMTTLKESVDKVLLRLKEVDLAKLTASAEGVLTSVDKAIADAQVADLSREARGLLTDARKQVNDLNTAKLSAGAQQTLATVDQAVLDVNTLALSQGIQSLIAEVRLTNVQLQKVLASPKPLAEPSNLPEMIARLNKTLGRIDRLVATERPQIEMILANFKDISDDLKALTASLKQHPSDLLFSTPPSQSEAMK